MDDLSDVFGHLFSDSDGLIDGFDSESIESIDDLDSMINGIGVSNPIDMTESVDFNDAMNEALSSFNQDFELPNSEQIPFVGHTHHEPFPGEADYNSNNDITFVGKGDKYSDNDYNQQQADKWFDKEQDCLANGDPKGAEAAHRTAMDHQKRIKL